MIDELKSRLQKTYGETIKRIHLISITERRKKGRKEEVREGKGRKNQLRDMKVKVTSHFMSDCDAMDYSLPGSSAHGNSPGRNTGVGYHALLQGICQTRD